MTNLLTPLKKLGKKMTGKDIAGTNLVTVVDDIANKYTGSGGGGGEGGGGADAFFVNIDMSGDNPVFDKTFDEIMTAWNESPLIFGLFASEGMPNLYYNCYIGMVNSKLVFWFITLSYGESGWYYSGAEINEDGQTSSIEIPFGS